MHRSTGLCLLLLVVLCSVPAAAQDSATSQPTVAVPSPASVAESPFANGTSEWMVGAGPAWGVSVFHSAGGHDYVLQTISWGRVLTDAHGPGVLRGRFELAFEVVPIYAQYAPTNTYGFGLTPLVWRWNFEPHEKFMSYAELAGGGLWTRSDVPERTTSANFTAHASYGIRYFIGPTRTINVSYRFHHISNGNRFERNPGVNAHVLMFGLSLVKRR